ncbi:fimbrial protein [Serratia liquefaciens]|uniref:fimbrial protein n=1 Tax=Serratia liquefaciens TaxID=614 RepID=UPI0021841E5C|nr:fimbrial protein [Serratia liquefaciens]CAI2448629.1 Type-1A pilin [Serratia liquefaciens]
MKGHMKTLCANNGARQKNGSIPPLLILCILGLGGLCSTQVMACAPINGWKDKQQSVSFGDVIIQRDSAVGTVLASKTVAINTSYVYITDGYCRGSTLSLNYVNGWSPINGIAATNIAGIGIRLTFGALTANQSWYNGYSDQWSMATNSYWLIELIKTGPTSSGHLTAGTWGKVSIAPATGASWTVTSLMTTGVNNITSVACSLNSTSINVPLGDVSTVQFTAIGATAGDKTFDIGLNCDKGARINVALAGTQNTDTTDTSVLALTNAGQTGTAKGVGVQLLYGGVPLKINNNIVLKTSVGGQETLPFTARYYQTNNLLGPGKANSSATLNITYQ